MKGLVEQRAVELAEYIVANRTTVRAAAKKFGVSKSTVHMDVTKRLSMISPNLAQRVNTVLQKNKAERHIRGGIATKEKYMRLKKS